MYKVIGSDGKIYGPISADVLRQWLGEGRLNAATLVQPEGADDWRPLSALAAFAIPPAVSMPPSSSVSRRGSTNVLAVASVVCGLLGCLGFCCCCCGPPFGAVGLVLALVALMDADERDRGLAILGLVLSILAFGVGLLLPLLRAIWIPWGVHYRWNVF